MRALVVAEHDHRSIKTATLHAVTAAKNCAAEVDVLVAGHEARAAAEQAAQICGIAKVLHAEAERLKYGLAEDIAAAVLSLASPYSHIVFAATATGKSVAPRVAARLDVAQLSEITQVLAADTFERLIYAGNALAVVRSADPIKVITTRSTAFEAAAFAETRVPIEPVECTVSRGGSSFVGREAARSAGPELTSARVVVSGGRAFGSKENFDKLLLSLAEKLGAAVGASRAAVDAGYASNDCQVGQTGKVVAPGLYIAVGISGAIQHLAGMKDAKVIVAINKDPEAPIFSIADYGLEADLFTAIPQLLDALG